jgi:hypothetical protein
LLCRQQRKSPSNNWLPFYLFFATGKKSAVVGKGDSGQHGYDASDATPKENLRCALGDAVD